jgi:hypothetical protein
MSGAKRHTQRRKGVEKGVLEELPQPGPGEEVVRVVESIGGNLLKIETSAGEVHLCRLPQRFSRVVFVKRGSLLIAQGCTEDIRTASGQAGKVKYSAEHVLFPDQVRNLQALHLLPRAFHSGKDEAQVVKLDEDGLLMQPDMFVNRNKPRRNSSSSSSSSSGHEGQEDA